MDYFTIIPSILRDIILSYFDYDDILNVNNCYGDNNNNWSLICYLKLNNIIYNINYDEYVKCLGYCELYKKYKYNHNYKDKYLNLNNKELGRVPDIVTLIPEIYVLNVCNNKIKYIPNFIINFNNLTDINLSNNKLKEFPKILTKLESLEYLNYQ